MDIVAFKRDVEPVSLENSGTRGAVFWIAFGQMLLTILTLGIGRFWMITRLRRFHWSAFRLEDEPFEYTGKATEKLIGFLIAVVILAVYLTVVNLALTFVGLSYFQGEALALNLSILALAPLGFWAQYRARRYILARTRWRGIRFGALQGAWGYTFRAMGMWGLTLLTAGLAYPFLQMLLARYTTERTYFGDLRFTQMGSVWPLFRSWLLVITPFLVVVGFAAYQWADIAAEAGSIDWLEEDGTFTADLGDDAPVIGGLVLFAVLAAVWAYFFYIRHSVYSFRYLNSNKVLGDETTFDLRLTTWSVIGVYLMGSVVIAIISSIVLTIASGLVGVMVAASGVSFEQFEAIAEGKFPLQSLSFLIGLAGLYLFAIAIIVSLSQAFITMPLMRLIARTTEVYGMEQIAKARQRARDEQVEAGGFADALGADVGGAF